MKKLLLVIILISTTLVGRGQPPTGLTVTYFPSCPFAVGQVDSIMLSPIFGVIGYTWLSNSGNILIDGQPTPYTTVDNVVTLAYTSIVPVTDICVFAFNGFGNSDTACLYVNSTPYIAFSPINDSTVTPNSSGLYGISAACLTSVVWTITGDANINGIGDTVINGNYVTLNFGPTFTGGILCVYGINTVGLYTDTICMNITVPTGIQHPNQTSNIQIYPNPAGDYLVCSMQFGVNSKKKEIIIYDMRGKEVLKQIINNQYSIINIQSLQSGIYFIEINGVKKKFVKL